jgi:hypothetical protein
MAGKRRKKTPIEKLRDIDYELLAKMQKHQRGGRFGTTLYGDRELGRALRLAEAGLVYVHGPSWRGGMKTYSTG